ncbi:MAG TPA: T9SS type A sorting domain-containing protein, partial [Flavobacteriales bacterium]|nr:T9SS type A sorting domain-containing protein [Flavobacteriales bacterium]
GCTDTDQVTVTVNPIPAIPVVTANGTTLTSSAATAYQWYLNGSTIGGQTGQSIVVTNNGTYMVVVTNASGCSNQSAPFAFNSVGVEEQSFINRIEFFPNPFSGNATIRLYAMESSQAVITLTDVTGKLVMNKTVTLVAGVNEIPMSEKEFAAENGNYFLTVEIGGKTQTIKAIKID